MRRAAVVALALALGCSTAEGEGVRSVLLVTLDTVRADHLSSYGYARETSPNLDAFLARGVRFRYAFSTASRTAPSHVSLLTGLYPSFSSVGNENALYELEDSVETLAEHGRASGLRTLAIISNPVLGARFGFAQGFDEYDDRLPDVEAAREVEERIADRTARAAIGALDRVGADPFFLWVHFQDPHGPYAPPPIFADAFRDAGGSGRGVALRAGRNHSGRDALPAYQVLGRERRLAEYVRRYDTEIRYLDAMLGRLFDALDARGLLETTLVVVTADHGEAFGEDGYYCAHGHAVGPDQTRVPLGFVGPGIPAATVLEGPVSNLDVFATVLDALGLDEVPRRQSRSLWAALREGREPEPHVGYAEGATQRAAFTAGSYVRADSRPLSDEAFWSSSHRYTRAPHEPLGAPQRFPLGDGPREVAEADDPLLAKLSAFQAQADASWERIEEARGGEIELRDEDEQRLRALGYVE